MMAQLCAIIVNLISSIFRGKGEKPKAFTTADFMPDWWEKEKPSTGEKEQTVNEIKDFLKQFVSIANRRANRPPPPKRKKK